MTKVQNEKLLQVETTCGTLLYELQIIWDEVGEKDVDRDKMLLELEQECLEVYRRKVDQANRCRAQLRQAIADSEAELAAICSAMGERPVHIRQSDQSSESLKDELSKILPQMEEMRKRKIERRSQFLEVLRQVEIITNELSASTDHVSLETIVDENDLSMRKLEELHRKLHALQTEKSDRLKQIEDHLNTLNSLCSVLGMDFMHIIRSQVNPSLCESKGPWNISNVTIDKLAATIQELREVKIERMQKLQDLATTMLELWNLMDTPIEEQLEFQNVTRNLVASEDEVTESNSLSIDFLKHVETEVSRLDALKASKMKELVLKKRLELDDICRKTHMIPEFDVAMEHVIQAIDSGEVDPASILEQIELQISKVKEEALTRKEILERVEKWVAACEEECWLEEYNRDDNRYNAGKGAHLTLKRAEKARALVNKLPGMVEALASKTIAWEKDTGTKFLYDGIRVLSMLEDYTILRQEKEQEQRRQRDQKKLQGQLIAEQEVLYGSKPSPAKPQCAKKGPRFSTGGQSNRRLSLGATVHQTPKRESLHSARATPQSRTCKKTAQLLQKDHITQRLDDSFTSLSTGMGRKCFDMAATPLKKHSFGSVHGYEPESPITRKPFSPVSTAAMSSKANIADSTLPPPYSDTFQKTLPPVNNDLSYTTPSKPTSFLVDEENRTPKAMTIIPIPHTPATISVPMQTYMTPALSQTDSFVTNVEHEKKQHEEIEYSFEERRFGFVVPKTYVKSLIHG